MIKINSLYSLDNISDCYYINNNLDIINVNTNTIKSQSIGKRGYKYVSLNDKNNKQIKVYVHKIVALAFICNAKYDVINHIDGNKLNNSIENLEFTSQKENVIHAFKNNLTKRAEKVFVITYLNGNSIAGTIKDLILKTGISKGTLYDLFYKHKGSVKHNIKSILLQ